MISARDRLFAVGVAAVLGIGACNGSPSVATSSSTSSSSSRPAGSSSATASFSVAAASASRASGAPFRFAHVVVVVEENHSYSDIKNGNAPYIHALMRGGVSFANFYAITHPSEPNYQALFSGSTQGLNSDACPVNYHRANIVTQLRGAHRGFTGFSEGLPSTGYRGCTYGAYARRHSPWVNFTTVRGRQSKSFRAFPTDYRKLPSLAFVTPNLDHDMHDGTIKQADTWLHSHLGRYASWARSHNSLLIVTWDEDDKSESNRIPTIFYGARLHRGTYTGHRDLYTLLRTLEWLYGLKPLGQAAHRSPITHIWTH